MEQLFSKYRTCEVDHGVLVACGKLCVQARRVVIAGLRVVAESKVAEPRVRVCELNDDSDECAMEWQAANKLSAVPDPERVSENTR